jgi:hypothetical protein
VSAGTFRLDPPPKENVHADPIACDARAAAVRDITRREFKVGNEQPTLFPLKFQTTTAMTQFQYRVRWKNGTGVIYHFRTKIYDPDTTECFL